MTFAKTALACLAAGLTLGAAPAEAAMQNKTGCPIGSWTDYSRGRVSISWSFQGIGPVMAFHPDRVVYGGGVAPLSDADLRKYDQTFEDLRAAAAARRQVTIYWDDASRTVTTFIVRWNQPC